MASHFASHLPPTPRTALRVTGSAALFSLALAYIAEYGFALLPCELCLWQRIPFYGIIGLALASLFSPSTPYSRLLLIAVAALLFGNAVLAGYHTGVEHRWWPGPTHCSGDTPTTTADLESLRAQILAAPLIRCDKPAWQWMGITMASANVFWCLLLFGYAVRALLRPSPTATSAEKESPHE